MCVLILNSSRIYIVVLKFYFNLIEDDDKASSFE